MPAQQTKFRMSKDPVLGRRFLKIFPRSARLPEVEDYSQRCLFSQARSAIYHGLRALHLSPGDVVLLPAYLCAAAIEPVIALGATVEFYRIDCDFQTDFADLRRRLRPETKAVLAVHYFGFPCEIAKFRQLCDEHKLILVEDCAHVLQGEADGRPIGSHGDMSVFSWRKFLPLYDGGELVLNSSTGIRVSWDDENFVAGLKAAKNLIENCTEHSSALPMKAISNLLKLLDRGRDHLRRKELPTNSTVPGGRGDLEFDESLVNLPMSRVSRWVFERSDVPSILAKRQENLAFFRREFSSSKGIRLLCGANGTGHSPWVAPLIFEGVENAHLALRARGIPAVTWDGVRHPAVPRGMFPEADFLYENLVMLPVHQNLREEDLHAIVEESCAVQLTSDRGAGNCTPAQN
jgi:perosamine synthetase